jgi:hypothetical protein
LSLHNKRFPRVHHDDLLDARRAHAIDHSRDDSIPGPGVGSHLDFSFRSMAYTFADRDRKAVEINLTTSRPTAISRASSRIAPCIGTAAMRRIATGQAHPERVSRRLSRRLRWTSRARW